MKRFLLCCLAFLCVIGSVEGASSSKNKKKDLKLKKLKAAKEKKSAPLLWHNDLDKAILQAKRSRSMILVLVTGSDWCPPCMALEREIFSHKEFRKAAAGNVVLVKADFPKKKAMSKENKMQAMKIAKRFNVKSYPTVLLLNSDGRELDRQVGYRSGSPKSYLKKFRGFKKAPK